LVYIMQILVYRKAQWTGNTSFTSSS
jgi:hypothetical protein